jgi:transcription antitermination factor NusG
MAVACLGDQAGGQAPPPTLMPTPSLEAEAQSSTLAPAAYPWFALQVRIRYEAEVALHLESKGYKPFLPVCKTRRRWSDRVKLLDVPLFPGYVFCRFNPHDRLPILKTPGVRQIVGNQHTPLPVDDSEIRAIHTLILSGAPNQPHPFLTVGNRVRIESGALSGLEGILVDLKGRQRLVLSVTLLCRSVAVEIDSADVVPLRPVQRERARPA